MDLSVRDDYCDELDWNRSIPDENVNNQENKYEQAFHISVIRKQLFHTVRDRSLSWHWKREAERKRTRWRKGEGGREGSAIDLEREEGVFVQLGRLSWAMLQAGLPICHYCFLRPSCEEQGNMVGHRVSVCEKVLIWLRKKENRVCFFQKYSV